MSNLVKAIAATDTGDRKLIKEKTSRLFQDVFSMRELVEDFGPAPSVAKLYRIGVTLGSTCVVTETEYLKDEYALGHAIGRTKKQVIEAVFGEFRQDFRLIERHLYNYEFEEAATALRRMEDKMFSTED
jgi:HAMP domain-containing protein